MNNNRVYEIARFLETITQNYDELMFWMPDNLPIYSKAIDPHTEGIFDPIEYMTRYKISVTDIEEAIRFISIYLGGLDGIWREPNMHLLHQVHELLKEEES